MIPNKKMISEIKGRKAYYAEKNNPLHKLSRLLNTYHSIDDMYGTTEEKDWAKQRLRKQIMIVTKQLSPDIFHTIRSCLKDKRLWERMRESLI